MEVEPVQNQRYVYQITNYNNQRQNIKTKKDQLLEIELFDDYMTIKYQKAEPIKSYLYDQLTSLVYFAKKSSSGNAHVFVITEKNQNRPSVTFRIGSIDSAKIIYEYVNQKIALRSEVNQTETTIQRRNLISVIKAQEQHIYKDIYEKYKYLFSGEWLDSVLFEDHPRIKEYNYLAQLRAGENERKLILAKAKARLDSDRPVAEPKIPLERYDEIKTNEGMRFYDNHKQTKFIPKQEDKEEDMIVDSIANMELGHFVDTLEGLNVANPMMIESEINSSNKLIEKIDKNYEQGFKMSKADIKSLTLMQDKLHEEDSRTNKRMNIEDDRQFNEIIASKVRCWLKIFYRVLGHSQIRREHIVAIDQELNKLVNAEPRIPIEFEEAIKKTQSNILQWKRNEVNRIELQ